MSKKLTKSEKKIEHTVKNKKAIEQIEHAKLTKVICEFGMSDKYN